MRLRAENIRKDFERPGGGTLTVLNEVSLEVEPGEFVAITGPSGSGKSSLLGILAGLDQPSEGQIWWGDTEISRQPESSLAALRSRHSGFIFQNFHLIATLKAWENVQLPSAILGDPLSRELALEWLERVGLGQRAHHYPRQLSGGEMQRVAIARAAIGRPGILFADEPTGNLDTKTGDQILGILKELNRESSLVLVTHNLDLADQADRVIRMRDGHIVEVVPGKGSGKKIRRKAKTGSGSTTRKKAGRKKAVPKKKSPTPRAKKKTKGVGVARKKKTAKRN